MLVDLLLKIAYSICSGLVGLLTPSSLPAAPDARLDSRFILPTTPSLYPITIHRVEANPITVFVRGNHGELHQLSHFSLLSNTNEIFLQMEARTGIPRDCMSLLLGWKAIEPNLTLQKSGIRNECLLNVLVKGNGGGKGDPLYPAYHFLLLASCKTTEDVCICCSSPATSICDTCGKFCDECLERRHRHPSRFEHSAKVAVVMCFIMCLSLNVISEDTGNPH